MRETHNGKGAFPGNIQMDLHRGARNADQRFSSLLLGWRLRSRPVTPFDVANSYAGHGKSRQSGAREFPRIDRPKDCKQHAHDEYVRVESYSQYEQDGHSVGTGFRCHRLPSMPYPEFRSIVCESGNAATWIPLINADVPKDAMFHFAALVHLQLAMNGVLMNRDRFVLRETTVIPKPVPLGDFIVLADYSSELGSVGAH